MLKWDGWVQSTYHWKEKGELKGEETRRTTSLAALLASGRLAFAEKQVAQQRVLR